MSVVGYSYDAAVHCPDCTREMIDHFNESGISTDRFLNGEEIFYDSENNPIHAIFDIDECGDCPEHCDDCGAFIDNSWTGEACNYAVEAIQEYLVNGRGSTDVLDTWADNLAFCIIDDDQRDTVETYELLRKKERDGQA